MECEIMVRKLVKPDRQCKNLNELYVLMQQALKREMNIDLTNDKENSTINVIAVMEGMLSIFTELKNELNSLENEINFDKNGINGLRESNKKLVREDIKKILDEIRGE